MPDDASNQTPKATETPELGPQNATREIKSVVPASAPPAPEKDTLVEHLIPAPKAEVFIADPTSNAVTSSNPLGIDKTVENPDEKTSSNKWFKKKISSKKAAFILVVIIFIGVSAILVNQLVFNRITTVKLIAQNAQFYLKLSVKKNPQAETAKTLVKKFPGGDNLLKQFDKYYTNIVGADTKNPLLDITNYANDQLIFTRISSPVSDKDTSTGLFSFVPVKDAKTAKEDLADFSSDTSTYTTISTTYGDHEITNIKLKAAAQLETPVDPYSNSDSALPLERNSSTNAAAIDKYLVASDRTSDVKSAIDLSKVKKTFGFGSSKDPQSLADSKDYQTLNKYLDDKSFLTYFQRDPLTPYNDFYPFYFTSVNTYANQADTDAKTFQKISRALNVTLDNTGAKVNSYAVNLPFLKPLGSKFAPKDSLAASLPEKFSGVAPTFYFETTNVKGQWDQQKEIMAQMKDSKNRNQRQEFEDYSKSMDISKKTYQDAYGIDYENDLLGWMTGQVATIFNAGSKDKGPELLVVAKTNNQSQVEDSLAKISVLDPVKQENDRIRQADVRSLGVALSAYYFENYVFPNSLQDLVAKQFISTLPEDPTTKQGYTYTLTENKTRATITAKLENGQTITYDTDTGTLATTEVANDIRVKATKETYKSTSINNINIFNYGDFKYSLYFAVTKDRTIIAISDSDSSVKQLIDNNSSSSLSSNANWKTQFSKVTGSVQGLSFIEPVNLMGLVDYLKAKYPDYQKTIESYSSTTSDYYANLENAVKGYLKTIKSIGSVVTEKSDVTSSATFVNIVELPAAEKKLDSDSINSLFKSDENSSFTSVLGISTQNLGDKVKTDFGNTLKNLFGTTTP